MREAPYRILNSGNPTNRSIVPPNGRVDFQSGLEKYAIAIRDAMKTVQYYSPEYDYWAVVTENNYRVKNLFKNNELGR